MKKVRSTLCCLLTVFCLALYVQAVSAQAPKPKHINRAIELLEQGQPVYYTGSHSGTTALSSKARKMRRPMPTTSATTWNMRPLTSPVSPNT